MIEILEVITCSFKSCKLSVANNPLLRRLLYIVYNSNGICIVNDSIGSSVLIPIALVEHYFPIRLHYIITFVRQLFIGADLLDSTFLQKESRLR